jgi:UDP-sulfoquinovose synthase
MNILICGIDGYLGWALAQYLARKGHKIFGIDNLSRRKLVREAGGQSIFPISSLRKRKKLFKKTYGNIEIVKMDLANYDNLTYYMKTWQPDAIVHLAEMPSAPFSMENFEAAAFTHNNNLIGTLAVLYAMRDVCPNAHLVKLGTMGEYGTPETDIPEGYYDIIFRGVKARHMFPRQPGSFYHATKVHDTINIEFACRVWGIKSTDIMQGVVYGTKPFSEAIPTRFDCDAVFGTAINRFVTQAIVHHPITLFGRGHQKRGFLPLQDSMQCISLIIENPPKPGEYRTINQIEEVYDLTELAHKVTTIAEEFNIKAHPTNIANPRVEKELHRYEVDHNILTTLGYQPTSDMEAELRKMFNDLLPFKRRIEECYNTMLPKILWRP